MELLSDCYEHLLKACLVLNHLVHKSLLPADVPLSRNYERLTADGEASISLSAAKRMFRYGVILFLVPLSCPLLRALVAPAIPDPSWCP